MPTSGFMLAGRLAAIGEARRLSAASKRLCDLAASALLLPLYFALPALRVDLGALGTDGLGILAAVLLVAVTAKAGSGTGAKWPGR